MQKNGLKKSSSNNNVMIAMGLDHVILFTNLSQVRSSRYECMGKRCVESEFILYCPANLWYQLFQIKMLFFYWERTRI